MSEPTLAERLFQSQQDDETLWFEANIALGYSRDDWEKYPIIETFYDWYDQSVELIFTQGSDRLTKDQASKIFDLGFSIIYASYGPSYENGDGEQWVRNSHTGVITGGRCNPRQNYYEEGYSSSRALIQKYRDQLDGFNESHAKVVR